MKKVDVNDITGSALLQGNCLKVSQCEFKNTNKQKKKQKNEIDKQIKNFCSLKFTRLIFMSFCGLPQESKPPTSLYF